MSANKKAGKELGGTIVEAALLMAVVALVSVSGVKSFGAATLKSYRAAGEAFNGSCYAGSVSPTEGGSRGTCRSQPSDKEASQRGK